MRPLSIGEILDRSVTLFIKNAWLFLALAAVIYVPIMLAQLSLGDFWSWYMREFSKVLAQPGNADAALAMDRAMIARAGPVGTLTFAIWLAAGPLVAAAMAHVTGNIFLGTATSFGEALQYALRRWGRAFLYVLLWMVAVAALFFGIILVLGTATVALGVVMRSPVVAVLFMFAIFIGLMFAAVLASVSAGVGFMAAIIEDAGVISAFDSGLRRTLNRQTFWRTTLIGLVLFAIAIGFSTISSLVGFGLLASTRSGIPLVIINAAAAMVQFGFFVVFMALFYYDVRVRREGLDLESLASQLP